MSLGPCETSLKITPHILLFDDVILLAAVAPCPLLIHVATCMMRLINNIKELVPRHDNHAILGTLSTLLMRVSGSLPPETDIFSSKYWWIYFFLLGRSKQSTHPYPFAGPSTEWQHRQWSSGHFVVCMLGWKHASTGSSHKSSPLYQQGMLSS